jgi:5'(3')-deoxyribonucleotidase
MKIGIDVDGVLANFNESFIDRIIEVTGKDLFPPRPFDIPTWHYPQHYGYTEAEMDFADGPVWKSVKKDPTFWYLLQPYLGVPEFLSTLDSGDHEIYFVTNRAGIQVKAQTESWLEFHGFGLRTPNFGFPTVLISSDKGTIAKALRLDLYIDDNDDNCLAVHHDSTGTKMVQLARPWNHSHTGLIRVESLDDFAKLIIPQETK